MAWGQAQTRSLTLADAVFNPKLNPSTLRQLQWCGNSEFLAYVDTSGGEDWLFQFSAKTLKKVRLVKANQLQSDLKKFPVLTFTSAQQFYYNYENQIFAYDLKTLSQTLRTSFDSEAENIEVHPATARVAYTKGVNIHVAMGKDEKRITHDLDTGIVNGRAVHRNEFGINKGLFWSPQANWLAFYRMDESMVTTYPLANLIPYPAKLRNIRYPMAGQRSHQVKVGVYNITSSKTHFLDISGAKDQYLTNITWSPDEQFIYVAVVNRDQNQMSLNRYRSADGQLDKVLFTETDAKYVEPETGPLFFDGGKQFLWLSERSGTNQIYHYTAEGQLLRPLSQGETVTSLLGVDAAQGRVWYVAATNTGLERKLYSVSLSGGPAEELSKAAGTHSILLHPDKLWYADSYTNQNTPRSIDLADGRGKPLTRLFTAPNPIAEYLPGTTRLLTLKADDGTPLQARIILPPLFDSSRKYPVVVYVYGGPHAQLVTNTWLGGSNLWMQYMAQQGFIVFTLDNRGSSGRGQAFESATFRRLGQVEMADQLTGLAYLKTLPYVNASRIGVHGWSFGGFMTTTLMTKAPDAFKVGVAGGPVIDWALYEVMYTERYMDSPVDNEKGYEQANLLNQAKNLKGRLLMIHGTDDDVVVWQHSQLFVKACVDAGTQLDYMIYPGHVHNVTGKDRVHLMRKITQYFLDFL